VLFNFGGGTSIGPFDKRGAMSFHDYCLSAGADNSNAGCDAIDDTVFEHADAQARRTGDALLLTEFGATTAPDILSAMADRADRFMVGWQEWHYCGCDDPTTSGPGRNQALVLDPARPPRGANLDTGKLAILSRPHPEAVAGTPSDYGFDAAAHRFTLRWTPQRADGHGRFGPRAVTDVVVPRRQYPRGYAARVSGGRVRSHANSRLLRVTARRGAAKVTLTVTPAG
jgi:endoglycosylceramidase